MPITSFPQQGSSSSNPTYVAFDGTNTDSFGRLRVSQPFTLFDSQNRYQADSAFDTSTATGGSTTYLPNESTVSMDVTTSSGSEVVRQTFRCMPYQPGKGLLLLATFVMNTAKTGLRQRVGYFGTQNGVFFQLNDSTKSFIMRTYIGGSVDDTSRKVDQSAWNGDKLDGTGASGLTLDLTKPQILWMDFEWLGVGSVRCGFIINGEYIVCHTYNTANVYGSSVYMTTATLPIRYEITNTSATASSSTLKQICSSIVSEGGFEELQALNVVRRTSVLGTIGTTFLPLLSVRLNSSYLNAVVLPNVYNVLPTTNQNYEVCLVKNSTLTGASWVTGTYAHVDYDVSATAMTTTESTIVQSDFVTSSSQGRATLLAPTGYNFDLQIGASLANVSDTYTLGIRTVSGATTGDAVASFSFYDLTL